MIINFKKSFVKNMQKKEDEMVKVIISEEKTCYAKKLSYETIQSFINEHNNEELIFEDCICDEETCQKLRIQGYWVCIINYSSIPSLHIIPK